MRIAILSDFHLGYERFRADAYSQAEEAMRKASEMSDMIIIPGDIFDSRIPKPDVIAEAITLFRNLSGKEWKAKVTGFVGDGRNYSNVPVIAIPGTHERRAQDAADPVDILGLAGLLVDVSNATAVVELDGERVAVRGMGGIADDRFKEVVSEANPGPVSGAFNIFVFHESLYELLPFNSKFMKFDELPEGFDLYVNGHIHSRFEADVHGKKLLIPGSTVITQLKPSDQGRKGFFVFDTKSGKYEFIEINSRRFVISEVDLQKCAPESYGDALSHAVDEAIGGKPDIPIVRLVVPGNFAHAENFEFEISTIPKKYAGRAIVEVARSLVNGKLLDTPMNSVAGAFGNMSVKDYGMGVLAEKMKMHGVVFDAFGAADLFELLGLDEPRERVVELALEKMFG